MGSRPDAENMVNWESLGMSPEFMEKRFPGIAGKYKGLLIVIGGGRCVWDDLEKAGMAKNHNHDVLCINDIMMHYPGPIEHVYSNDHRWLPKWIAARRELLVRDYEPIKHSHSCVVGGKWTWPWPGHGTSALNAVYTGLALGYDEIWLCGVPLDNTGHYFDPPWIKSTFEAQVSMRENGLRYWSNAAKRIFNGKVKSFSGRTRDLLGEPKR